jgi:hypothetical protein
VTMADHVPRLFRKTGPGTGAVQAAGSRKFDSARCHSRSRRLSRQFYRRTSFTGLQAAGLRFYGPQSTLAVAVFRAVNAPESSACTPDPVHECPRRGVTIGYTIRRCSLRITSRPRTRRADKPAARPSARRPRPDVTRQPARAFVPMAATAVMPARTIAMEPSPAPRHTQRQADRYCRILSRAPGTYGVQLTEWEIQNWLICVRAPLKQAPV